MNIRFVPAGLRLLGVASLALAGAASAQTAGDPVKGKAVYNRCVACHDMKPGVNKIGPSLNGIVGRKSATVPGFNYSPAMKKAGLTWDPATLDAFLEKPMKQIPGNRMAFVGVPKPEDRANLIAYMKAPTK